MSLIEKARPRGGDEGPRGRRRRRGPWLLLLLLVLALAALWWLREEEPPSEPEPAAPLAEPGFEPPPDVEPMPMPEPAPEPEAPPEAAVPEPEPAPVEPLPPREDSDTLARELAGAVSKHPLFLRLVADAGLVDRFVLLVDNLAEGIVPRRELAFLRPQQKFLVVGQEPEQRIDPASYRRYDALAAAIDSLDARSAVRAYRRVAPLCEESYRALGYPEGGFERRLRAALAHLLSTPVPDEDPLLVPETLRFEYADPALESLSDAQKQLLRMGPGNAQRVRAKLRAIQSALGPPR